MYFSTALNNKLFSLPGMISPHFFAYEAPIPSQKGEYYHPHVIGDKTEGK